MATKRSTKVNELDLDKCPICKCRVAIKKIGMCRRCERDFAEDVRRIRRGAKQLAASRKSV